MAKPLSKNIIKHVPNFPYHLFYPKKMYKLKIFVKYNVKINLYNTYSIPRCVLTDAYLAVPVKDLFSL